MRGVLLTGATGFLGAALATRLDTDARYTLVNAVRRMSENLPADSQSVLVGGLGASTDWSLALFFLTLMLLFILPHVSM